MTVSTTADLLARARQGDRSAADRLFANAADRLMLFVRLRLGHGMRQRLDSMDVVQEAWLQAQKGLPAFAADGGDPDRAFLRWLCGIAENRMRDLAAFHGAARRAPARERVGSDVFTMLQQLQRSGHGPATSLVRREERDRLVVAIEQLPADEQEVVVLRHFEGLELAQIAERTGRSESAVRRALGRAVVALGRRLGANGEVPA